MHNEPCNVGIVICMTPLQLRAVSGIGNGAADHTWEIHWTYIGSFIGNRPADHTANVDHSVFWVWMYKWPDDHTANECHSIFWVWMYEWPADHTAMSALASIEYECINDPLIILTTNVCHSICRVLGILLFIAQSIIGNCRKHFPNSTFKHPALCGLLVVLQRHRHKKAHWTSQWLLCNWLATIL